MEYYAQMLNRQNALAMFGKRRNKRRNSSFGRKRKAVKNAYKSLMKSVFGRRRRRSSRFGHGNALSLSDMMGPASHFGKRRRRSHFGHGNALSLSDMMGPASHFGKRRRSSRFGHGNALSLSDMMGPASHFGKKKRRSHRFGHGNALSLSDMMGPASHFGSNGGFSDDDEEVSSLGNSTMELLFGKPHRKNHFGKSGSAYEYFGMQQNFGKKRRSHKKRASFGKKRRSSKKRASFGKKRRSHKKRASFGKKRRSHRRSKH